METILAIESAIGGGSLAVLENGRIRAKWHGSGPGARSEELLPRIASILEAWGLQRSDLTRITVSTGPGSYTGIRIGLATAIGLSRALSIPCGGVSLLESIHYQLRGETPQIIVVPIGRNGFCWRVDSQGETRSSYIGSGDQMELLKLIRSTPGSCICAHSDVYKMLTASETDNISFTFNDIGRDMAVYVGLSWAEADRGLQPFYARDTAPGAGV